jgi:ADP-ribose pyrophosphatase YjhB (NUDIX family)
MHWIQKHILQQLSTRVSRRYSELKPENIDGNLFMYHMQKLQNNGYVNKDDRAYKLSENGKIFASRMSLRKGSPVVQPKIVVMLVCQNDDGDYLLFRWRRQPYYGLVSFPFSKLHFGRSLQNTLQEALSYKTQLSGEFNYLGDVYVITRDDNGAVAEHILAHLYKVTHVNGTLSAYDGLTGEPFWGKPKDVLHDERVAGFADIFELVDSGEQGFIKEITVTNRYY